MSGLDFPSVEFARQMATAAHDGQVDRAGQPYIGHPERVAERTQALCAEEAPQLTEMAVTAAWLHDVLEDTPLTSDDLCAAGFSEAVIGTVEALTTTGDEPMDDYAARVAALPAAVIVKRADLADNGDPVRLDRLDPATRDRLEKKYAAFRQALERALAAAGPVVLCDYRTADIDIYITARLDDGRLRLAGQDLGPAVRRIWGDSDYEYGMILEPASVKALQLQLGTDDILSHLALTFTGPQGLKRLRAICDNAAITYEFSTYL